ncbi:MAG: helicase HerA domain-containing protein [Beijerinckiaceae bacterium]
MTLKEAFLDPRNDDLFSSVAAFSGAQDLEVLDVWTAQKTARDAIVTAVANALRHSASPGSRIALVKGEAGSGKSHVLTTTFKRLVSLREVYPSVLQLTAPVTTEDYDVWLLDAIMRELSARYFADESGHSPLRRLGGHLLDRVELVEQQEFLQEIYDADSDGAIGLARRFGRRIQIEAAARLAQAPSASFIAAVLLAAFGDPSALNYLRYGNVDSRVKDIGLPEIRTPDQRIGIIRELGLVAQIVHGSFIFCFDQVENTVRLASEDLYVHTLTQAVRLSEQIVNCAIIVAVLADEYDDIVGGRRGGKGLTEADRDRIEHEVPSATRVERGTPEFCRAVVARRLAVLRQRAGLPSEIDSFEPLPDWLVTEIDKPRNIRLALREVARFREASMARGEIAETPSGEPPPLEPVIDFDKEWADFLDSGGTTLTRLTDRKKAELLAWWAEEASREHINSEPVEVTLAALGDAHETPTIDIVLKRNGDAIARRKLALCEAPNRNQFLLNQVQNFLVTCDAATPAILRTNGFPKGPRTQPAPALRALEKLSGLKLDLGDTEWHILARTKDFFDQIHNAPGLLEWRREKQWLQQLLAPLRPLIAFPDVVDLGPGSEERNVNENTERVEVPHKDAADRNAVVATPEAPATDIGSSKKNAFPVFIGTSFDGTRIEWAPYREQPNHLNNFSVLITGDAGAGKTETIRVLIDAACRAGLAVTIFDFKADYCDEKFAGPLGIEVIDIRTNGLPFNPLQPPPGGAAGAQPIEHVYEFAGILKRVFGLGAVQEGHLRDATIEAYKEQGIDAREWIDPASKSWPTFSRVLDILRNYGDESLVTRLSLLSDLGLFGAGSPSNASFETFLKKRVCLKLSGLPNDDVKKAIAEILIVQLHGYALRGDQPRRLTRLMVFDEAHRVKDSKRLEQLAREGRAFGVGIVIGTQFPDDIPETMAGNLATQLFLMNNQAVHRRHVVTQLLGTISTSEARSLLDKLVQLRPQQGLFANAHHNGVFVKIMPHYLRHPA